jgi:hypothetical protein
MHLGPHRVDISMANSTPPTGALNAVHTPHAAPQATRSRMSRLWVYMPQWDAAAVLDLNQRLLPGGGGEGHCRARGDVRSSGHRGE